RSTPRREGIVTRESALTPPPPPCAARPSCARWGRGASCAGGSISASPRPVRRPRCRRAPFRPSSGSAGGGAPPRPRPGGGWGADVGGFLPFDAVPLEVVAAGVFPPDHPAIALPTGLDHHRATVLEVPERKRDRLAIVRGDQHAIASSQHLALVGRVGVEQA